MMVVAMVVLGMVVLMVTMVVLMMVLVMVLPIPVCKLLEHLPGDEVTGQLKVTKVRRKSVLDQLLQLV